MTEQKANYKAIEHKLTFIELLKAWQFDWGMQYECPYIWFGWWLISFDTFQEARFPQLLKTIEISFLPD